MGTTTGSVPAPPSPRHLQLEVTSACNLSCAMCLVSHRPRVNRADGAMSLELFTRLVDGAPGLERLTLQGLGEPLLHPHLADMVAYAKARGVEVGFNSNAMLLSRGRADRLVALGLDWLHVSLDGATAGTYEGIRAGADLDRVVTNLRGLQDAKHDAGSATPAVRVVFVAMRRNVAELPALVGLVAGCGVSELHVQGLSHVFATTGWRWAARPTPAWRRSGQAGRTRSSGRRCAPTPRRRSAPAARSTAGRSEGSATAG